MSLTDYSGAVINEGDKVVFATRKWQGGAQMRIGIVTKIHDSGRVSIQPTHDMRGNKFTRTIYINQRTGKLVNPFDHIKENGHTVHVDTGEELTSLNYQHNIWPQDTLVRSWASSIPNPDFVPENKRKRIPLQFHDYIMEVKLDGGSIVTPQHSQNIVKL